jgi:hypothetical protein
MEDLDQHLTYIVKEDDLSENTNETITEVNINDLMKELDSYNDTDVEDHGYSDFNSIQMFYPANNDRYIAQLSEYDLNFTAKQLSVICEYYEIKTTKMKKGDMIESIVAFENDIENAEIVVTRQQMWYYIQQLKEDKFMKKFVIF